MSDIIVTLPKSFRWLDGPPSTRDLIGLDAWLAEGGPPGCNGQPGPACCEYAWSCGGSKPLIHPGERVYVCHFGRLIGFAPLIRIEDDPYTRGRFALIRAGGARAVTIHHAIKGFQGWRYVWWERTKEFPFDIYEFARETRRPVQKRNTVSERIAGGVA